MDLRRAGVLMLGWGLLVLATGCSMGRGSAIAVANSRKKPPLAVASRAPALPVTTRAAGMPSSSGLASSSVSPLDRNSADRLASPRYPAIPGPASASTAERDNVRPAPRWDQPDQRLPAVEDTQDLDPRTDYR